MLSRPAADEGSHPQLAVGFLYSPATSPLAAQRKGLTSRMHCQTPFQAVCRRTRSERAGCRRLVLSFDSSSPARLASSRSVGASTLARAPARLSYASRPLVLRLASQHVPPRLIASRSPTLSLASPASTRPLRCPSTRATHQTTQSQTRTTLTRTTRRRARVEEQALMRISSRDGAMAAHR